MQNQAKVRRYTHNALCDIAAMMRVGMSFSDAKRDKVRRLTQTAKRVLAAKLSARPHKRAAYSACVDLWIEVANRINRCSAHDVAAAASQQITLGDSHAEQSQRHDRPHSQLSSHGTGRGGSVLLRTQ